MALVTANGLTAFDFQMRRPRVGAWHADMYVDSPDALSGRVTLVIDDDFRTFIGTAIRTGEFGGTAQLRVVAGAGGLGLTASPKYYNSTTVGIVLGDLLSGAGEQLAATADAGVLATAIGSWTTPALPVGTVIAALLQAAAPAAAWRMLPNGTLWVGLESWPAAGVDSSTYQIMEEEHEQASMLVMGDRPEIDPGTTFEGRRVSYVQDDVPHVAAVQTRIWFEDVQVASLARLRASFAALVHSSLPRFDYRARYWARVVSQSGNQIDVIPEAAGVPDMGRVTLVGPAGQSTEGIVGGRVLVGWSWPELAAYAESFDGSETVAERVIGGLQVFVGEKLGAMPVLLLDPATIAWFAAVGTGSGAGPMPETATSLFARAK